MIVASWTLVAVVLGALAIGAIVLGVIALEAWQRDRSDPNRPPRMTAREFVRGIRF